MASLTTHYGLTRLGTGDKISDNDFKYGHADRDTIDQKLFLGAEGHQHTGEDISVTAPPFAPVVTLSATVGRLPAGTTIRYKYTYVDTYGNESGPSPEATYATPLPVLEPAAPTLATSTSGGTLMSGSYYYRLSAFNATGETLAQNGNFITTGTGHTNRNTLTLPSLPSGALGFNVYRLTPGGTVYHYLITLNTAATPATTWIDTGAVVEDCDHNVPSTNSTNITTALLISLPGATPTVPVGYTWRLYRTFISGNYTASFLHWVNEYTQEATPTIHTPYYTDIGRATATGSPPTASTVSGSPSKINLNDGAEVTGVLPAEFVEYFPSTVEFSFAGALSAQTGKFIWLNEWPEAEIVGVRAVLGVGSAPASQSVIVDVNGSSDGQNPTFTTLFTTQANRPMIATGDSFSDLAVPNTPILAQYDQITVDIDQAGGGATPTDRDMTVIVYLKVRFY